jgi:hypothetical protein
MLFEAKYIFRRFIRKGYNLFVLAVLKAVAPDIKILGSRMYKKKYKRSDVLMIAAPGSSLKSIPSLGSLKKKPDVLGVNYFIGCNHLEVWGICDLFVIEPHPIQDRYVDTVFDTLKSENVSKHIIIKGLGSPSKFWRLMELVKALVRIEGVRVIVSADRYMADYSDPRFPSSLFRSRRAVLSGQKTLHWCLSFAYVMGYPTIVLAGFDFGKAYAYAGSEKESLPPNTWVDNDVERSKSLRDISELEEQFRGKGVRLEHLNCEGPLATILKSWEG